MLTHRTASARVPPSLSHCPPAAACAQGSKVLEYGHVVVLLWGSSQADVKKLETVLTQLCAAYRPEGGRTLVVLSQREKLVGTRRAPGGGGTGDGA